MVTLDSQEPKTGKKDRLASVLDFACGSGSLLLNVRKRMGPNGQWGIGKIYGQEKNITTYNLARMNMLLHGVKDTEFEIYHGDTLINEWDTLRGLNPAKKPSFDAIVANPPFSYRWEPTDAMGGWRIIRHARSQDGEAATRARRRVAVQCGGLADIRAALPVRLNCVVLRRRRARLIEVSIANGANSVGAAYAGNHAGVPLLRSLDRLSAGFYKPAAPTALRCI